MEQPSSTLFPQPQTPQDPNPLTPKPKTKKPSKMPTPQDLISHYESQGMPTNEAATKVIDDLQNMLFRVMNTRTSKKDKFMSEASRKLDTANARLAILEMKLDSKPGYPESFAIGIASAAAFRGLSAVWPQVCGAISRVWSSVKSASDPKP